MNMKYISVATFMALFIFGVLLCIYFFSKGDKK